jgi:hypothetical protein
VGERYDVFLSYSRNDSEAATLLLGQLRKAGLEVFRDQESIRAGELWLDGLQKAVRLAAPSSPWEAPPLANSLTRTLSDLDRRCRSGAGSLDPIIGVEPSG